MKKTLTSLALLITLLGIPIIAKLITNLFDFSGIDPDNAFLWLMVRHTLQALFILAIMFVFVKAMKFDFKLGLGNKSIGLNYLKKFIIIFSIGCVVFYLVAFFLGQAQPLSFNYTFKNIAGYLGFQLFFSGPSEEIIFRAFSITVFANLVSKKRINNKISYANLFAAIVFGLAHLAISFSPFKISFSLPQIIISIILGYFDGDCYEKSGSVIYPMIMHSYSNVLMVSLTLIFTGLF